MTMPARPGLRPEAVYEMASLITHALGTPALLKLLGPEDAFGLPAHRTLVHLRSEMLLREQLAELLHSMPAGTTIDGIVGSRLPGEEGRLLGTMLISSLGPVVMFGEGRDIASQIASMALHPCPIDRDSAKQLARSVLLCSAARTQDGLAQGALDAMSEALTQLSRMATAAWLSQLS
jgi:hypothetical protein